MRVELLGVLLLLEAVRAVKYVIHILPHTHLDPGWIVTYDSMFNQAGRDILTSLTNYLYSHEDLRFNYADMAYLGRWWDEQQGKGDKNAMQKKFRTLVERGQIQFVGGHWTMQDEMSVQYFEVLEAMEVGARWIWETFGERVHVYWPIDAFGHTSYTVPVLDQMGIDVFFISRIGTVRKDKIKKQKKMHFVWDNQGHQVLFHLIASRTYGPPEQMQFDKRYMGGSCTIQDMEKASLSCLEMFYKELLECYIGSDYYPDKNGDGEIHIPAMYGDDQTFKDAEYAFKFIEHLINALNEEDTPERLGLGKDVEFEARVSLVDDYLFEFEQEQYVLDVFAGDLFPLIDDVEVDVMTPHPIDFWVAFYSNRPVFKQSVRDIFRQIRLQQKLLTFVALERKLVGKGAVKEQLVRKVQDCTKEATILIHHDAITGTCQEQPFKDFKKRAENVRKELEGSAKKIQEELDSVGEAVKEKNKYSVVVNEKFNKKQKDINGHTNKRTLYQVFNAEMYPKYNATVAFPAQENQAYLAFDSSFKQLKAQHNPKITFNNDQRPNTQPELVVLVEEWPAFSFMNIVVLEFNDMQRCLEFTNRAELKKSFCVNKASVHSSQSTPDGGPDTEPMELFVDKRVRIQFGRNQGLMKRVEFLDEQNQALLTLELNQTYLHYDASKDKGRSAFYIFDPQDQPHRYASLSLTQFYLMEGALQVCMHSFFQVTLVNNGHFDSKVCVNKHDQHRDNPFELLDWSVGTKGVHYFEQILRTQVLKVNGQPPSFDFFTDDSFESIWREVYTPEQATAAGLIKGPKNYVNGKMEIYTYALNAYPCNSGLILENGAVTMGMTFSHALLCQFHSNDTFDLMLTRSESNPDHKGLWIYKLEDQDYAYLDMKLTFSLPSSGRDEALREKQAKRPESYEDWKRQQFHLVYEKRKKEEEIVSFERGFDIEQMKTYQFFPVFENLEDQFQWTDYVKTAFDFSGEVVYLYLKNLQSRGQFYWELEWAGEDLETRYCVEVLQCQNSQFTELLPFDLYSSGALEPTMHYQRYDFFNAHAGFNKDCAQLQDPAYPKTLDEIDGLCIEAQELFALAIDFNPAKLKAQEEAAQSKKGVTVAAVNEIGSEQEKAAPSTVTSSPATNEGGKEEERKQDSEELSKETKEAEKIIKQESEEKAEKSVESDVPEESIVLQGDLTDDSEQEKRRQAKRDAYEGKKEKQKKKAEQLEQNIEEKRKRKRDREEQVKATFSCLSQFSFVLLVCVIIFTNVFFFAAFIVKKCDSDDEEEEEVKDS